MNLIGNMTRFPALCQRLVDDLKILRLKKEPNFYIESYNSNELNAYLPFLDIDKYLILLSVRNLMNFLIL